MCNKDRIINNLTKEEYNRMHCVWKSSRIPFFSFFIKIIGMNLFLLASGAMPHFLIPIFAERKEEVVKPIVRYFVFDDGWGKLSVSQFPWTLGLIAFLSIVMIVVYFLYANRDFQKFDLAFECFILISYMGVLFNIYLFMMVLIPNVLNRKGWITMVLTGYILFKLYYHITKSLQKFQSGEMKDNIILVNKWTERGVYLLLFIYPFYSIFKGKVQRFEDAHFLLMVGLLLVVYFIVFPYLTGWQVGQIVYRVYFVKYSEECRKHVGMTEEEWYGEKHR